MTVVPAAPAVPESYSGLDALAPEDLSMPRLSIGNGVDAGVFIDSLSGEKFSSVDVIILGIVKQRILWPAQMGEQKTQPLCRSLDFERGTPDPGTDEFPSKFPWKASGFDQAAILGTEDKTIPCDACPLKDWGSHPSRDNVPWCNEQVVLAILLGPSFSPAILTTQGSGLKPTKSYLTSFVRDKQPPFNCHTTISLDVLTRGQVTYSVPRYMKGEATDGAAWTEYVTTYNGIERFVKTPRARDDGTVAGAGAQGAVTTPSPAATPAAAAQPAPAAPVDEEPLPF